MLGSAAVLRWHAAAGQQQGGAAASLQALGWVTLGCQALLAATSLGCIVALPPPEAQGHFQLLRQVCGLGGDGSSSGGSECAESAAAEQQRPLLSGDAQGAASAAGLELAPSSPRAAAEAHERPAAQQQQDGQSGRQQHAGASSRRRSRHAGALFDDATREFLRCGPPYAALCLRSAWLARRTLPSRRRPCCGAAGMAPTCSFAP